MHIKRNHNVGKEAAQGKIDSFLDELMRRPLAEGIAVKDLSRNWTGDVMNFSFKVKKGMMGVTLAGVIQAAEDSVTLDFELPALAAMFVSEDKVRATIDKELDPLFPA